MSFDINALVNSLLPEEGIEKSASEVQETIKPSVADELKDALMTKSASEVQAEAEDLGRQLARRLMEKAASNTQLGEEGDKLSEIEVAFGKEASEAQPDLAKAHNAESAAEQAHVDGVALQSGNTVEGQTAESLQKGLATQSAQATSEDMVRKIEDGSEDANMQKAAAVMALVEQGVDFYGAADLVGQADMELQKEAAFAELVEAGYNFEDAVELVKAASEMGQVQDEEFEKVASLQELMEAGYTFDDAAEIVKEAGLIDNVRKYGAGVVKDVKDVSRAVNVARKSVPPAKHLAVRARNDVIKDVASRNKGGLAAAGLAGTAAVGGAGYGVGKAFEKKAAFEELLAQGFSFDEAAEAVL